MMDRYKQILVNLGLYGVNPYLLQGANYMKDRNINNPLMLDVLDNIGRHTQSKINMINGKIGRYPYMSPYIKE